MNSPSHAIRILIVDDHVLVRDGIAIYIESQSDMDLAGQAQDGHEAVEAYARLRPDVTLLDLQMPNLGGMGALRQILAFSPDARIIVLTTFEKDVQALVAIQAGAAGYLLKSSLRQELGQAIRTVHGGRRYIQLDIAETIALAAIGETLTSREAEVLKHAAEGRTNRKIAQVISIGEETVKSHMRTILQKLNAKDRTQAVAIAVRRGIIDL